MIDYTLPLEQLPDPLPIMPLERPFDVTITPPGSKSITCRAYVLAALAQGTSRIIRPLRADDTDTLLKALCTLGAKAQWVPGSPERKDDDYPEDVLITGVGGRFPRGGELYMGEGGAPTRFMIACACLADEPVTIDASARMRQRPIAEGVKMLRSLGARIEYVEEEGRLPVRVVPSAEFKGGTLTVGKTASSQFISAVMLIGQRLHRGVRFEVGHGCVSLPYVMLTRRVLREWGQRPIIHVNDQHMLDLESIEVKRYPIVALDYTVESDASSATYWFAAAAICCGCAVQINGLRELSAQGDLVFPTLLERVGAWLRVPPPEQGLRLTYRKPIAGIELDMSGTPDAAVTMSVVGATAADPSTITGLHTLRHKETDRLAALATELRKVGCAVETGEDWIRITPMAMVECRSTLDPRAKPGAKCDPVTIETYNDHRMAMAFAVLGLARPGISIRNPRCVAKSYPTFWKDFAKLYGQSRAR